MKPEEMEKKKIKWGWSSKKSEEEPDWPKNEEGENVPAAFLTTVSGNMLDLEMTISMLRSFGVPAVRSYPLSGRFMRLIFGFTATGMDIFVPETMLDFARELLESSADIDGETDIDDSEN